jgi:hypothetical protein
MNKLKEWIIFGAVAVLLLVVLPLLNTLPSESMFWLPDYYLNLFGKYLSLAIMAMGLGLLWGYAGILGLGQAVFFGLGGYSIGMHLMLQIGPEGSKYGDARPDFMVWNQILELPWYWPPYSSVAFALAATVLVPMLFAAVFGYLMFRSRIQGVYIAIVTQALAFAAWLLFSRNETGLGGTNGLTDYKTVMGYSLPSFDTEGPLHYHGCVFTRDLRSPPLAHAQQDGPHSSCDQGRGESVEIFGLFYNRFQDVRVLPLSWPGRIGRCSVRSPSRYYYAGPDRCVALVGGCSVGCGRGKGSPDRRAPRGCID